MNKFLTTASILAALTAAPAAYSATFDFSLDGWSDEGTFFGSFEAEDLNNDGQISSFDGEVTSFNARYESSQFFSITFDSLDDGPFGFGRPVTVEGVDGQQTEPPLLTGLVFTLDGTGQLGDDAFGEIEGLGVYGRSSGSDFGNDLFLAVGPGPFNICDGTTVCGGVFRAEDVFQPIIPVALSVDEPVRDEPNGDVFEVPVIPETPLIEELSLATNTAAITVTGDDLGDPEGLFEATPVLPDAVNDEGGFVFNLDDIRNLPGRIFFIDPEIATGYTYEITGDEFFAVQAPSLAAVPDGDGQYLLTYGLGLTEILTAGEIFEFAPGVTSFTITGIDPTLGLDPADPLAFVTGIAVRSGFFASVITQTPITEDISPVPLPAGGVLLLSGLAGLALARRRRNAHAN